MLKWIAGGAAGVAAFAYLMKLNRASQTIQTQTTAKVHKVSLSGISVRIWSTIKNPNKLTINLQKPLINIMYAGKSLGSSNLADEKITVPAYGQETFEVEMHFGWLALAQSLGITAVNAIRNKDKSSVQIDVVINTAVNGIPFTDTQSTILNF